MYSFAVRMYESLGTIGDPLSPKLPTNLHNSRCAMLQLNFISFVSPFKISGVSDPIANCRCHAWKTYSLPSMENLLLARLRVDLSFDLSILGIFKWILRIRDLMKKTWF